MDNNTQYEGQQIHASDVPSQPYQQVNQQSYQQPYQQPYQGTVTSSDMTIKDWILTFLIMMIPIANIVMIIVWACGSNEKRSRKTWAQASLILSAITFVLIFVLTLAGIGIFAVALSQMY